MKTTTPKLLTAVTLVAGFTTTVLAQPVHTAQGFQSALTAAATAGGDSTIVLYSDQNGGYYQGNFNYNSVAGYNLTIQANAGASITIDGNGTGRGLDITGASLSGNGNVIVSGITFLRNCGNYQIGALRIAGNSGGSINVNNCQFLSPTTGAGEGLEITSGLNANIANCSFIGKTNNYGSSYYDGNGLSVSGVTGTTLLENSTLSGNYLGYGAYVTAGQALTVSNNVVQTNYNGGLYFDPSPGTQIAFLSVSNNVFNGNRGYGGAYINNVGSLILENNLFEGASGSYGAYAASVATAAITGNTFIGNITGSGGASFSFTTGSVIGNTFSGNSGVYGGVYLDANKATVTGNTFSENSASGAGGIGGGGANFNTYNVGNLNISNNVFSANKALTGPGGGAVVSDSGGDTHGNVIVTGNTFNGNYCSGNYAGGALYVSGGCTNLITGNTFENNSSADGGGAVYANTAGTAIFSDNLVVSNIQSGAAATGGGILVNAATNFYMINNTVFGNYSADGGGGVSFQTGGATVLYVFNNIIYGNSAFSSGPDVYLAGTSQNTFFEYNDVDSLSDMYGLFYYTAGLIYSDPKFFDPVNGDYHFPGTSPCAGAGTITAALYLPQTALNAMPPADLDGTPRVINGLVDLGCYETNTFAYHPADEGGVFEITAGDFNDYSNAWKNGLTWTLAPSTAPNPNPIPANYLTRAGYLYQSGLSQKFVFGPYYNTGQNRPINWQPSTAPGQPP